MLLRVGKKMANRVLPGDFPVASLKIGPAGGECLVEQLSLAGHARSVAPIQLETKMIHAATQHKHDLTF